MRFVPRVAVAWYPGKRMMVFFDRSLKAWHYLLAGLLAAAVPMALGLGLHRMNPGACYDSPCLLPLALLLVPPCAAPALTLLFALNRRLGRPVPDGWLPGPLICGTMVQIVLSTVSLASAEAHMRRIFLFEMFLFPQGFLAGLAVGAVFWGALLASGRQAARI